MNNLIGIALIIISVIIGNYFCFKAGERVGVIKGLDMSVDILKKVVCKMEKKEK